MYTDTTSGMKLIPELRDKRSEQGSRKRYLSIWDGKGLIRYPGSLADRMDRRKATSLRRKTELYPHGFTDKNPDSSWWSSRLSVYRRGLLGRRVHNWSGSTGSRPGSGHRGFCHVVQVDPCI
jgi:hypothetical protein